MAFRPSVVAFAVSEATTLTQRLPVRIPGPQNCAMVVLICFYGLCHPYPPIYIWLVVWNIFIFPYIGNNNPNWLILFRGVEATNQISIYGKLVGCRSYCFNHLKPRGCRTWTSATRPATLQVRDQPFADDCGFNKADLPATASTLSPQDRLDMTR